MSLVKHSVVIWGLAFASPAFAQSSDEALFDTIFDKILSTVPAKQQADDTQFLNSESDGQWAHLYGDYPVASSVAYTQSDRGGPDLFGERPTAAPQAFPNEPGAIMARDLPGSLNAFDKIFDVLLETLAAGQKPAAGKSATR